MLAVITVVDDDGDARRALKGVNLAAFITQFLNAFGTKYTVNVNIGVFGASSQAKKVGSKNHGIQNIFWTAPSKTTVIYPVFIMLQEVLFCMRKRGWGGSQNEQKPPE